MSASSWQPGVSGVPSSDDHGPEPSPVSAPELPGSPPDPLTPDPAGPPSPSEPPESPGPPLGREIAWSVAAGLVIAALGIPLGLLWAVLAPDVPVVQGENGPLLTSAQPEQFVAADGWFTFLGIAFGILITVAAWYALRRYRGAIALTAVTLGTIGAALLASWAGSKVGLGEYERLKATAAIGEHFTKPAELRAGEVHLFLGFLPGIRGDLLAGPLAAAATYTLLAGWSPWPSLRPEPSPTYPPATPIGPAFTAPSSDLGAPAPLDAGTPPSGPTEAVGDSSDTKEWERPEAGR
ncbi:hypothetical protein J2S43_000499 [Catenuloplanes nepalensis]|uniref:DUF2567 domain-containing protein n=1 Tax=Catenuloplanes nepalensis TaxID=587533 RepID=A0ABT9MKQ2_9ACTN|nr:DUF2567 domain-containing protein [Catenuloplanes nepalensis]MDP9791987.1 hypothetical protein [Catenuloplanes nepalensis]